MSSTGHAAPGRLAFHDALDFVELDPSHSGNAKGGSTKHYMSTRPAWVTGGDLPFDREDYGPGQLVPFNGTATYGGHVYAQAGLVAARCFEDSQAKAIEEEPYKPHKKYGVHVSKAYLIARHGVFGLDRLLTLTNRLSMATSQRLVLQTDLLSTRHRFWLPILASTT